MSVASSLYLGGKTGKAGQRAALGRTAVAPERGVAWHYRCCQTSRERGFPLTSQLAFSVSPSQPEIAGLLSPSPLNWLSVLCSWFVSPFTVYPAHSEPLFQSDHPSGPLRKTGSGDCRHVPVLPPPSFFRLDTSVPVSRNWKKCLQIASGQIRLGIS